MQSKEMSATQWQCMCQKYCNIDLGFNFKKSSFIHRCDNQVELRNFCGIGLDNKNA